MVDFLIVDRLCNEADGAEGTNADDDAIVAVNAIKTDTNVNGTMVNILRNVSNMKVTAEVIFVSKQGGVWIYNLQYSTVPYKQEMKYNQL